MKLQTTLGNLLGNHYGIYYEIAQGIYYEIIRQFTMKLQTRGAPAVSRVCAAGPRRRPLHPQGAEFTMKLQNLL